MRHDGRSLARRGARPLVEDLEGRLLLYSASGGAWPHPQLVTYSFVPDGTDVGGYASNLFQTFNAKWSTATWEGVFQQAAAIWEQVANVNIVQVPDNGATSGTGPDEQGTPGMGDIRISGLPSSVIGSGTLGYTLYPPPLNGNSVAGDMMINTSQPWKINSDYDLLTVAIHEFGHALGLGESQVQQAVMYGTYNGIDQSLAPDDVAGIDSIYGARPADYFMATDNNSTWPNAANLNPYMTPQLQVGFAPADLQTSSQSEWYKVTVPSGTTGTMTITMQATGLSLLSPAVLLYNSSLQYLGYSGTYNAADTTTTLKVTGVTAGQVYYVQAVGDGDSEYDAGDYAIFMNFGSAAMYPWPAPATTTPNGVTLGGGGGLDKSPRGGTAPNATWVRRVEAGSPSTAAGGWGAEIEAELIELVDYLLLALTPTPTVTITIGSPTPGGPARPANGSIPIVSPTLS